MGLHSASDPFVLLDAARLQRLQLTSDHLGAAIAVTPRGPADNEAEPAGRAVTGEAMKPISPAHLGAIVTPDGKLRCSWVRRSRRGWAWLEGVDVPLEWSSELYRVRLKGEAGSLEVETDAPNVEFTTTELAAVAGGSVELSVMQVGDYALSRPAKITVAINQG